MSSEYHFDDYMSRARERLEEGNTDTAMDWVNQALSLRKHLDGEAIARAYQLKAQILIAEEEYTEAEEALQQSLDLFRRNADGRVLLGELMLLDGRHEGAASAFESALEISPQNVHARSLLIFCYGQLGKIDQARECFEKCVELEPELADSYCHMGIWLFLEGKPEAGDLFQKALSRNPVLSGPHYYLGRMKASEGDVGAAQDELRKELELNPANSLAELQLVGAYLLSVPWAEAVKLFDEHFPPEAFCEIPALMGCRFHFNYELLDEKFSSFIQAVKQELPQTPQNVFHLAKIYRCKSLFGEAAEQLKEVMEADNSFRPAYGELAEIYRIQDEHRRACDVLEEAVALFEDSEAHCDLAKALLASGRYSEAEEKVRTALSLGAQQAEPHCLLGAILADRASRAPGSHHLMEEATASLLRALEIDPHHTTARTYLMHVAFQGGKYDECVDLADKTLKENPEDRLALSYSGRCFHAVGNLAAAEQRFVRLLQLYPDDGATRGMLAEVYCAQERFKEAAEELEQAIAIPGRRPQPELFLRLGEIYLANLDEPAKAREHVVRFLQSAPPGHPDVDRAKELLGRIKL